MRLEDVKKGVLLVTGIKLRKKYYLVRFVKEEDVYTFRKDFYNNILKEIINKEDLRSFRIAEDQTKLYCTNIIKRVVASEL